MASAKASPSSPMPSLAVICSVEDRANGEAEKEGGEGASVLDAAQLHEHISRPVAVGRIVVQPAM